MADEVKVIDEWEEPWSSEAPDAASRIVDYGDAEYDLEARAGGNWYFAASVHPSLVARLVALLAERRQESEAEAKP